MDHLEIYIAERRERERLVFSFCRVGTSARRSRVLLILAFHSAAVCIHTRAGGAAFHVSQGVYREVSSLEN